MNAQTPSFEDQTESGIYNRLIVTVNDQQKIDFLLEFLRHLDFVQVRKEPITKQAWTEEARNAFLASAGMWKDRDIDAAELRRRAWQRGNSGS